MSLINSSTRIAGLPHSILLLNSIQFYIYWLSSKYRVIIASQVGKNFKDYDGLNLDNSWKTLADKKKKFLDPILYMRSSRVIFRGKGFRVKLYRGAKKVTFNFGHSHWTKLKLFSGWYIFKIRRQNYVFISSNHLDANAFGRKIGRVRLVNRYTLRGLRLKVQAIKKRFGKISQYVSALH